MNMATERKNNISFEQNEAVERADNVIVQTAPRGFFQQAFWISGMEEETKDVMEFIPWQNLDTLSKIQSKTFPAILQKRFEDAGFKIVGAESVSEEEYCYVRYQALLIRLQIVQ